MVDHIHAVGTHTYIIIMEHSQCQSSMLAFVLQLHTLADFDSPQFWVDIPLLVDDYQQVVISLLYKLNDIQSTIFNHGVRGSIPALHEYFPADKIKI